VRRTHVSFESESPRGTADMADATALAARLAAGLARRGLESTPPSTLAYGLEFEIRHAGRAFHSIVGPVNDGTRQWLWFADSTLGRLRRWLGESDAAAHEAVLAAMHEAVAELGARSIRWYESGDWNEAPDERWHATPFA
jgi:hypothetical protein